MGVSTRKSISILLIVIILFSLINSQFVYGYSEDIVSLEKGITYTAIDLDTKGKELALRYPELIKYELLGYSFDKRPIYSLILTAGIDQIEDLSDLYVDRMHYMVIAGVHSREDVNPVLTMEMIEEYAKAYYSSGDFGGYNLKEVFNRSVIHFLPSVNPDGFDLVRQGYSAAQTTEAQTSLTNIASKNYGNFKSNMRGVDLNRNFPTIYLNALGEFVDYWDVARVGPSIYNSVPHMEFFAGVGSGSEVETQIIMDYMLRYDHRNIVTMHSRGKILYWNKPMMSREFNQKAYNLGVSLNTSTGYSLIGNTITDKASSLGGSGYESDFCATQLNKPFITVETLPGGISLPTAQSYYKPTFEEVKFIPLVAEKQGYIEGYYPYRLYVNGKYIRDFIDKDYAEAHAQVKGGLILEGTGKPLSYLGEYITRADFVEKLVDEHLLFVHEGSYIEALKSIGIAKVVLEEVKNTGFLDYSSPAVNFAYKEGVLSGDKNGNFRPVDYITPSEASIIVYKLEGVIIEKQRLYNDLGRTRPSSVTEMDIRLNNYLSEIIDVAIEDGKDIPEWARPSIIEVLKKGYFDLDTYNKEQKYLDIKNFNFNKWQEVAPKQ